MDSGSKPVKVVDKLACNYKYFSIINFILNYFMFYEMWKEGDNPHIDIESEEVKLINKSASKLAAGEGIADLIPEYDSVRKHIIEKVGVAVMYLDSLTAYEHVMNRMDGNFSMSEEERKKWLADFDTDGYIDNLLNDIIDQKNGRINTELLSNALGQLPMRMSRSKYIDIIKKIVGMYRDSDKHSLDEFLYEYRTIAMMYKPEKTDRYFTEYSDIMDEFEVSVFSNLDGESLTKLQEKLLDTREELHKITDLYTIYQKMINDLYAYALNEDIADPEYEDMTDACRTLFSEMCDVFDGKRKELSAEGMGEAFFRIEGVPEKLLEKRKSLETKLVRIEHSLAPETVKRFTTSQLLMSTSDFAELEPDTTEPVTDEYINKVTEELEADILDMIKNRDRRLVRAIMAMTLSRVPVFFNDVGEIEEYIENSIKNCRDVAELRASVVVLNRLRGE